MDEITWMVSINWTLFLSTASGGVCRGEEDGVDEIIIGSL